MGTCCNDVELVPKTYNLDTVAVEWSSPQGSITKPAVEWNLAHLRKCLRKVRKNKCRKKRVAVNCVQSCGLCIG